MMNKKNTLKMTEDYVRNKSVWKRMRDSVLFKSYLSIFEASTGLPLELEFSVHDQVSVCNGSQNKFCQLLNAAEGCEKCLMAQRCLNQQGSGAQSMRCFAGLEETVIPIMIGNSPVARLRTGQIFHKEPSIRKYKALAQELSVGSDSAELAEAYLATPVIEKEWYRAMVTLLASFSIQLTTLAKTFYYDEEHKEKNIITVAKDYIEENFSEEIYLNDVAEEVFMSPHHFCRKFKESVGVTMTDYITGRRVEEARTLLEESDMRITDIAFEVGFQSISQFNRSFSRVTGKTPSAFRKAKIAA